MFSRPVELLTDKQRVYGTAAGLIKFLRDGDHGILAHELFLMGEPAFIAVMRKNENPQSIAAGLTDAQLGEVYAHLCEWVKSLARKGAYLRKRKDWRS
jgi:hypothetical protein